PVYRKNCCGASVNDAKKGENCTIIQNLLRYILQGSLTVQKSQQSKEKSCIPFPNGAYLSGRTTSLYRRLFGYSPVCYDLPAVSACRIIQGVTSRLLIFGKR